MVDVTIQVDDVLFARFTEACEAIGVVALDYLELRTNDFIKESLDNVAGAPGIDDPRCRIGPGDNRRSL